MARKSSANEQHWWGSGGRPGWEGQRGKGKRLCLPQDQKGGGQRFGGELGGPFEGPNCSPGRSARRQKGKRTLIGSTKREKTTPFMVLGRRKKKKRGRTPADGGER